MNDKDTQTIYKACENLELEFNLSACFAIDNAAGYATVRANNLTERMAHFYDKDEGQYWYTPGDRCKEERILMLLFFAEAEGEADLDSKSGSEKESK